MQHFLVLSIKTQSSASLQLNFNEDNLFAYPLNVFFVAKWVVLSKISFLCCDSNMLSVCIVRLSLHEKRTFTADFAKNRKKKLYFIHREFSDEAFKIADCGARFDHATRR